MVNLSTFVASTCNRYVLMSFSCYVMGQGPLLVECVKRLVGRSVRVNGIITDHLPTRSYAEATHIPCIDPRLPLTDTLAQKPFDYLFSIVNSRILSADVLSFPRKGAINYHDGPLPTYAGVHATFWAILNGQQTHGITWHLMDTGLDTGPILNQQTVPITGDETSFSLNLSCFEAAITSFDTLLGELIAGTVQPQPQPDANRSYFARSQRPDTVIDWHEPTERILRLFRALDFGSYPNPFGPLKIWIQDSFFIVRKAERRPDSPLYAPGIINSLTDDGLLIATADGVIEITSLDTLTGEPVPLASLIQTYGLRVGGGLDELDPVRRQALLRADQQCYAHQPFWMETLTTFQPTSLPFDPRPSIGTEPSDGLQSLRFSISPVVDSLLIRDTTPGSRANKLLAALFVCLARLNGDGRVTVSYRSEALRQIGIDTNQLYADYVPFTVDVDFETDYARVCQAVGQEQERIAGRITYARDWAAQHPVLKSAAKALTDSPLPILVCVGNESKAQPSANAALLVIDIAATGFCTLFFNDTVWTVTQLQTLLTGWHTLLEEAVNQLAQPVKTLNLLTAPQRRQLLHDWNDTETPYPCHRLIHELVEEQARRQPAAVAVLCDDRTLTYDQLNRRANQLARHLQRQGVGPEVAVGLAMDRCPELMVGLLAILKAGGVYVPLDLSFPSVRLQFLLTETNVRCVLTQKQWADQLPGDCTLITMDEEGAEFMQEAAENLSVPLLPDGLAYILFTSGSTGQPKGVGIPHRGVVRLVKNTNYAVLDAQTTLLGMASVAFDASTFELWGCLANGGRLVLLPDRHPSLETINRLIETHQVNTLFLTTALFNVWVDTGIEQLTSIRQLLTGGEIASVKHLRSARRQLPHCRLTNLYGPTENTSFSSFYPVLSDLAGVSSVPIGTPVSNTQLYILDAFLQPVPVGITGELFAGGDGLARGYWHQPVLTARTFVSLPLTSQTGQRLYRTGDRARYLPDGTIEYVGRVDEQLKIRGHRIEPGEIEFTLGQHPAVREAVVVAADQAPGQPHLIAYVVIRENQSPTDHEWRTFLQERLPAYLIPTVFMTLSALPLNPSGKVDRRSLPPPGVPDRKTPGLTESSSPALTPTERVLSRLWSSLLNDLQDEPPYKPTDDFFASGGTSLGAIRLVSAVQAQFGVQLSLRDIFTHPTLGAIATRLDSACPPDQSIAFSRSDVDADGPLPMSSAQKRLWILHQLYNLKGTYNVPVVLQLTGVLNIDALEQSISTLVERHQVLRTTFSDDAGVLRQHINPPSPLRIPVVDLAADPFAAESAALSAWLVQEVYQPFTWSGEPLLRIRVARLSGKSVLLFVFHHSIFDGWSIGLLSRELSSLYTDTVRQVPARLPDLPIQYADYARWQFRLLRTEACQTQLAYWTQQLADLTLLPLPTDHPRPPVQTFSGSDYGFTVPESAWQSLKGLAAEPGVTPLMRLLTVFTILLHDYAQLDTVVVGIPIAGRSRPELQTLIGFFVNTLVIRASVSGRDTFRELVSRVRQITLDAFAHAETPFEQLVEVLNPRRSLALAPVVQVMLDTEEDTHHWSLPGLQIQPVTVPQQTAKFDLHLSFRETKAGLAATLNYNTDLFLPGTIQQLAHRFGQLAGLLALNPDVSISQFLATITPSVVIPQPASVAPLPRHVVSESQLTAIMGRLEAGWSRVLGVSGIDPDQDFFSLGGHSLLAIQLVAAIRRDIGYSLPVSVVFAHPTLRMMGRYVLTIDQSAVWQSLVTIRAGGNRTPFFCVHPIHGEVNYLYKLIPYLSPEQPVYGFQAVGLNGTDAPLTTIEAMAAHYLDQLVKQQPTGPYQLGGFSVGGVIAYEMANQLNRLGKEVALLVLFDAYPMTPDQWNRQALPIRTVLRNYWNYALTMPESSAGLTTVLREKMPVAARYLRNRLHERLSVNRRSIAAHEPSPTDESVSAPDQLTAAILQAYNRYQFQAYAGKIVLFRAADSHGLTRHLKNYDGGWGKYTAGVDVFDVPCQHDTLFTTVAHTRFVAEMLETHLSRPPAKPDIV